MKKTLIALAVGFGLALSASSASALTALTTASPQFIGSYTPPEPASATAEVGYINTLLDVANNTTQTIDGVTYTRSNAADPPDATTDNADKDETGNNSFALTNYTGYIIAKYDGPNGAGYVWYLTNVTDTVTVPAVIGYGLSHVSFYGNQVVPDGGTTLGLLGLGMLGLGYLRRRLS